MGTGSSIRAGAVLCGLVLGSGPALCQEPAPATSAAAKGPSEDSTTQLSLSYQTSDDCPDAASLIASFEQRLDQPSLVLRPSRAVVQVQAQAVEGAYRASVSILLKGGEVLTRSIEASTCTQAVEAIAFVLAVALDPHAPEAIVVEEQRSSEDEEASLAKDEAPHSSLPHELEQPNTAGGKPHTLGSGNSAKAALRRPSAAELRREYFGTVFLGPALVAGALPELAYGGQASLAVGLAGGGWWSPALRMGVSVFAPVVVEHTLGDARFQFWTTTTELCPSELSWGRFDFRPCGMVDIGRTSAKGSDTYDPQSSHRLWVSFGVTARLGWTLSKKLRLSAGGNLEFPVTRDGYHFDEFLVFQTPTIAGSWSLGMELQLW